MPGLQIDGEGAVAFSAAIVCNTHVRHYIVMRPLNLKVMDDPLIRRIGNALNTGIEVVAVPQEGKVLAGGSLGEHGENLRNARDPHDCSREIGVNVTGALTNPIPLIAGCESTEAQKQIADALHKRIGRQLDRNLLCPHTAVRLNDPAKNLQDLPTGQME